MLDAFLWTPCSAAAVLVAVALLAGWPRRSPYPGRLALGQTLGIGVALALGCRLAGLWSWPPTDAGGRFLTFLWPMVVLTEAAATVRRLPRALTWVLRGLIVVGAAPLLLYHSAYVADLAGPGTRLYSPVQTLLLYAGFALLLTVAWALLGLLAQRTAGRSLPSMMTLACAGAGVAVALSGSGAIGIEGLLLATALGGIIVASFVVGRAGNTGLVGLAIVGLFSTLVRGRFFAALSATNALLLFALPLLAWLPELPAALRTRPRLRSTLQPILVAVPVVAVLVSVYARHEEDSQRKATEDAVRPVREGGEESAQEYLDFNARSTARAPDHAP